MIGEAAHLFVQLGDAFAQLRLLSLLRLAAQLEQLALAGDARGAISAWRAACSKLVRELDGVGAVALGLQPARRANSSARLLSTIARLACAVVSIEPDKKLARLHLRRRHATSRSPTIPPVGC